MTPSEALFKVATHMLADLWAHQAAQAKVQKAEAAAQLAKTERQIAQLVDRIVETDIASVVAAYEARIRTLTSETLALKEKLASSIKPTRTFEQVVRTALSFLANPLKLWTSEQFEARQTVLKLAFSSHLRYRRNEGFLELNLSMPFKVLDNVNAGEVEWCTRQNSNL